MENRSRHRRALKLVAPFVLGAVAAAQGTALLTPVEDPASGLHVLVAASIREARFGCDEGDMQDLFDPLWVNGSLRPDPVAVVGSVEAVCRQRVVTADAQVDFAFNENRLRANGTVVGTATNIPLANPPIGRFSALAEVVFAFEVSSPIRVVLEGTTTGGYDVELTRGGATVFAGSVTAPTSLVLLAGTHLLRVGAGIDTNPSSPPAEALRSFDFALRVENDQGGLVRGERPPRSGGDLTDRTPPVVSSVTVDTAGGGTVTLSWQTNEPARSVLDYGVDSQLGVQLDLGPTYVRSHAAVLNGLDLDRTYHYRITVVDGFQNAATTPDDTFETLAPGSAQITGSRIAWQPLTLSFDGPLAWEGDDAPNPFLDFRLTVELTGPSGQTYSVPGFFDGDGDGGGAGSVWRARFAPDEEGSWLYSARFVEGPDVAVDLDPLAGTPTAFDGDTGSFVIDSVDPDAPGFYRWGKLEYVGGHYAKFRDGPYFLKTGCGSPENLLGFAGFDNTFDQGGLETSGLDNGLHRYAPHVLDWGPAGLGDPADPLFVSADTGVDSKGLVGALNYLSSQGVNSIYFLPMNLGGDGQETCPFVGYADTAFDKTHYDISKLHQWNLVFEHATRRGLHLHVVLAETEPENRTWLDDGALGVERKLFYRELVARFGHHLAIKWNLSEENVFPTGEIESFAGYLRALDPYDHPIGFHSFALPPSGDNPQWTAVLGDPRFSTNSIQSNLGDLGLHVERWREDSAAAGRPWIIGLDEITGGLTDTNSAEYRRRALYDVLFSGGHIEFYFGYFLLPLGGDLRVEDFRTREGMWDYARKARELMEAELPFQEMQPADELVVGEALLADGGGAEVFTKPNDTYAVFFPTVAATGTIDLSAAVGTFQKRWFDPHLGIFWGEPVPVFGGSVQPVGSPPVGQPDKDWVLLIQR